jgi:hypothetical protein
MVSLLIGYWLAVNNEEVKALDNVVNPRQIRTRHLDMILI